jgi:hypothetical protein
MLCLDTKVMNKVTSPLLTWFKNNKFWVKLFKVMSVERVAIMMKKWVRDNQVSTVPIGPIHFIG